jgi:hypothetical protein
MFYKEFCSCGLKVFFGRKTIDKLWTYQWVDEIGQSIEEASKKGGIVLLMTKNSLKSQNMQYELRRAISLNGRIYPIYFGEASEIDIESELNLFIGNIKWIKCQPNEQGVRDCVQRIVCDIKNRISNTP